MMSIDIQYRKKHIYLDLNYFIIDHNIINYAIIFKKTIMQVFIDANYISNLENSKSIFEYIFVIIGDIMCFNSTKQRFVAGYTIKAKYILLSLVF